MRLSTAWSSCLPIFLTRPPKRFRQSIIFISLMTLCSPVVSTFQPCLSALLLSRLRCLRLAALQVAHGNGTHVGTDALHQRVVHCVMDRAHRCRVGDARSGIDVQIRAAGNLETEDGHAAARARLESRLHRQKPLNWMEPEGR